MYCAKCGTECQPEYKFCRSCGAAVGSNGQGASAATPAAHPAVAMPVGQAAPAVQAAAGWPAVPPGMPPGMPPGIPPGMVPVVYQAYPGGPQQVYYVPAQGTQAHGAGFLEGVSSKIRELASTDKLEGFSLSETFSETFRHHGADAVEEYVMVGSSRTTPPIELVETGWPKPWMFFRQLALFAIAFAALYAVFKFTGNTPLVPAILFMGAFAVPVAVLIFLFEMNTPRDVSVVVLGKLFIMGGLAAICAVSFEYMNTLAGKLPGVVEETAKLAVVLLVMRSARYKYELNGILFGAAVGAGFAAFETSYYGLNAFLPALIQGLVQQGMQAQQAFTAATQTMVDSLVLRGILAPFGHMPWTAIAAGAFWRVKQDRPVSPSMLLDPSFLKTFAIPVAMHTLWDASVVFPNIPSVLNVLLWIGTGVTTWYVLFGLIQQGLRQVRDAQKSQLQTTLTNVEATLGLGMKAAVVPRSVPVA
jgi:protease PrsW